MRELMLASPADAVYPLEVRPSAPTTPTCRLVQDGDTLVISVSGKPGTDYWDYLRSVDALLAQFDARALGQAALPHPERLAGLYPAADEFIAIRRELDPQGLFLNEHLRPLFA